jgi:hypothetical protein
MNPRTALIVVLIVVECAVGGAIVNSVRGDWGAPRFAPHAGAEFGSGGNLVEGGRHRIFAAGSQPALHVDIGNADLTIRAGDASQFDISVSKSSDFGMLRATAPITAHKDGETVSIAVSGEHGWSLGDDRRVTLIVPPTTIVTVENAGDIEADGLRARASFSSDHGTVAVDDFNAPALRVEAGDKRISLLRIAASRLDVTSDDGRIEGSDLQVRDGTVKSSDGRVTLRFAAGSDTVVTAQSSDGKVEVANADGSSSETLRVGDGNGRFDVSTSDGNIYLSKL